MSKVYRKLIPLGNTEAQKIVFELHVYIRNAVEEAFMRKPVRIGVGGPVGSGKTALIEKLCKAMRDDYEIAVVTNDIFTKEDALILTRAEALSEDRIIGVETGGCPHTAVREDISMNLDAVDEMLTHI